MAGGFLRDRVDHDERHENALCLFVLLVVSSFSPDDASKFDRLASDDLAHVVLPHFAHDLSGSSILRVQFLNFNALDEGVLYFIFFECESARVAFFAAGLALCGLLIGSISQVLSETAFAVRAFEL